MNLGLIVVHKNGDVREVMEICRTILGISTLRYDGFTFGHDWRFMVLPKYMVPDKIRGTILGRAICYDTWLTREAIIDVLVVMRYVEKPEIDYVDEPAELKRLVREICLDQHSGSGGTTPQSR